MTANRCLLTVLFLVFFLLAAGPATAPAGDEPIRSGQVVEVLKSGLWSWIGLQDADGSRFWIMASNCTVGEGGRVDLLEGDHFERIRVESLGRDFTDCYSGKRIRINGVEVEAYGAHDLPDGCIDLGAR